MGNDSPAHRSLYQELILAHYRNPRNRGELEDTDAEIHVNNPSCGDEITLRLRVRAGRIDEVRFGGQGCSISQASASMMTEALRGRSLPEVQALTARFKELMQGSTGAATDPSLGDLRAFAGVARFPMRVRCALLAWNALEEAQSTLARAVPE